MKRKIIRQQAVIVILLILSIAVVTPVQAHGRTEIGPYAVVVGWVEEPAIVGERNAIFIEVTEEETPVTGVEATLNAELLYGGASFRANLTPMTAPGQYGIEIFPTIRGQYSVRLFGTIGDTEVDEVIEPEEVFSAARLQFPEAQPEPHEMQQQIERLEAELQRAQTQATVGMAGTALAVVALILSILALRKQRRA